MKGLKHGCSVVESTVEGAARKLIILSSEEPANIPARVLYSATALQPFWPLLQHLWTPPLKEVKNPVPRCRRVAPSRSAASLDTTSRRFCHPEDQHLLRL